MSRSATALSGKPAMAPAAKSFRHGDRVLFQGAGKDWTGVVTERALPEGGKSIHPRHDDTAVFVRFDETGVIVAVSLHQLEKARDRRR